MNRTLLGIVLITALLLGGCEEEFTPGFVQSLAKQTEALQLQVDEMQAVAVEVAAEIQKSEIVDEAAVAKLAGINEDIDKLQAQLEVFAKALANVPLTGDTAQDFISQLQAANAASGGVNPYVVPVGAGLSALSLLLGWLAKRNAGEAAKAQAKYQAHKSGVERTMKEVSSSSVPAVAEVETKLYANIGSARASLGV